MNQHQITAVLQRLKAGDPDAMLELIEGVYEDLRVKADQIFRDEFAGHTLQPTAIVHEACIRLLNVEKPDWNDRCHFLAIAAMAMAIISS